MFWLSKGPIQRMWYQIKFRNVDNVNITKLFMDRAVAMYTSIVGFYTPWVVTMFSFYFYVVFAYITGRVRGTTW